MHIEIQVALNFVISYLYNKLPRRRVNIFGEELEKALRDKFRGHWYPDKPFKGSAYRCLKTGDPIDSVLERAARESGVPISDILENLPSELSVWVDPGEVSFRIGEKGAVKILYTENNDNQEDSHSADREVTKTFNPEAQCFRPIDAVNTTMNQLSLSPKSLPLPMSNQSMSVTAAVSSPHSAASSSSPTYQKGSPNPNPNLNTNATGGTGGSSAAATTAFMQRAAAQAPLTFTTATFAQTKFGSTKLKTTSKRTNNSAYRMSPTEFSNYIKQRAIQQQQLHGHGHVTTSSATSAFGTLDATAAVSPSRSLSPNPLVAAAAAAAAAAGAAEQFYYGPSMGQLYPQFNVGGNGASVQQQQQQRSPLFDAHFQAEAAAAAAGLGLFATTNNSKYSTYLEPCYFANGSAAAGLLQQQQQSQTDQQSNGGDNCYGLVDTDCNNIVGPGVVAIEQEVMMAAAAAIAGETGQIVVTSVGDSSNESSPIATPIGVSSAANGNQPHHQQQQQQQQQQQHQQQQQEQESSTTSANSKLIDGINSFYGTGSSYQQLLVAN